MILTLLAAFSSLLGCSVLLASVISRGGYERYALPWNTGETILSWFGEATPGDWILAACCTLLLFFVLRAVVRGKTKFFSCLCRFRYLIAAGLFILCVLLEINNTSLNEWTMHLGLHGAEDASPLWGVSRAIRMDEWAVWSSFTFSQSAAGWPAVNPLIAGGGIDTAWISVGGIPAFSPAVVFKPFYWGFCVFGLSRGYSVLFAARLLGLFLVSFELARVYTRKNDALSLAAALLLTFCPYVQWWFSQSVAEVLIFSQAIILCLLRFLDAGRMSGRILWAVLLAWCFGCFCMVAYPSWLISVAYLLVAAMILILVRRRKALKGKHLLTLILPALTACALLALILIQSRSTLANVLNSEYPGRRMVTGGDPKLNSFSGLFSILLPYVNPVVHNSCESAGWVTLAPAGAFIAVYRMIRQKKPDTLSLLLLGIEVFFSIFIYVGVPAWLARVTLLFQANRPELVLALADTVLLIRSLTLGETMPVWLRILFSVLCTAFSFLMLLLRFEPDLFSCILLGLTGFTTCMVLFSAQKEKPRTVRSAACVLCVLALLGGAFVNPLQQGIRCVDDLDLVQAIREIPDEDPDSLWFMAADYPLSNLPLLAGKRTLNSTQPYPDPERWSVIDPDGVYRPLYNRFCHVAGYLSDDEYEIGQSAFDYIWVSLTARELKAMGVTYVVAAREIPEDWQEVRWVPLDEADGYTIYRLEY